ncbi:MAG: hypothetical protein V1861_03140 [Candidatus Micrarchaeota archaeon]
MRGYFIASILILSIILAGCAGPETQQNDTEKCLSACAGAQKQVCANGTTFPGACNARCYGFATSYEGACGTCKDTDGGKNTTVKGFVSAEGGNYTDYCIVFESVEEYFCNGTIAQKETIPCAEGNECHDGSCVFKMPPIPEPDCQDSDGRDTYTKGSVNTTENTFEDSCVDNKRVREYYCDQGARYEDSDCAPGYGCEMGMCIKIAGNCTETDGGYDIQNEGKVLVKSGLIVAEFLDKCLDDHRLREYQCSFGGYISMDVECGAGMRCAQASCREDLCTDSDDGYSIFREGGVNKGDELKKDTCTGPDAGIEYYCDNNKIINATFACPSGYICKDGRCEK